MNGFELSPADIPVEEILPGGPARDGIPALSDPEVVAASDADWPDDSIVMGVVQGGEARAYPVAILDWHELVNDSLGGKPILVSYCPLCGTGMVFDRKVGGEPRTFGVSGLLYKSDVLFYDRESESLWSQIESRAVTGPARGTRLALLRSEQMHWSAWRARHPRTTVLSKKTGHARDYGRSPYAGYSTSDRLFFPASFDPRYTAKMPTLGVRVAAGAARAYPAVEIVRAGGRVEESFEGHPVQVAYDTESQVFDVAAPGEVEVIEGYWFAWSAFHPETTVYVAPAP
ncbi:MAG: DUF3179 domain-containing protein [Deltaproteobacteria bacterium]|nr:DUF3179 domain-containing protein [Deltaproteobacteria bacterium]MBW2416045.1 DUF3179 domain-containing protein [Deltaproteobacteria bacterium]